MAWNRGRVPVTTELDVGEPKFRGVCHVQPWGCFICAGHATRRGHSSCSSIVRYAYQPIYSGGISFFVQYASTPLASTLASRIPYRYSGRVTHTRIVPTPLHACDLACIPYPVSLAHTLSHRIVYPERSIATTLVVAPVLFIY